MRPDELKAILRATGMSHAEIAERLGINRRTLRSWLYGERNIPEPIARILRLAKAGRINLNELEQ